MTNLHFVNNYINVHDFIFEEIMFEFNSNILINSFFFRVLNRNGKVKITVHRPTLRIEYTAISGCNKSTIIK